MRRLPTCTWLVALLFLAPISSAETEDEYVKEIDEWHQGRIERLQRPTGWLSLVGLHQLSSGNNRIGSADDVSILLPSKAPAHVGDLHVGDGLYRFTARRGADVTHDGEPVDEIILQHDQMPETTVLAVGSLRFYVIERGGQAYLRVKDTDSELLREFDGIERWPVDPRWRIEATWERYDPPKVVYTPDVLGNRNEEACHGAAVFEMNGETYRLEPTGDTDSDLFLVYGDETNGVESYGGGRFLYLDPPADGRIVVDFNRSYNPPCVFTPYATCPLPRRENRLDLEIEAGEKMWGEAH